MKNGDAVALEWLTKKNVVVNHRTWYYSMLPSIYIYMYTVDTPPANVYLPCSSARSNVSL